MVEAHVLGRWMGWDGMGIDVSFLFIFGFFSFSACPEDKKKLALSCDRFHNNVMHAAAGTGKEVIVRLVAAGVGDVLRELLCARNNDKTWLSPLGSAAATGSLSTVRAVYEAALACGCAGEAELWTHMLEAVCFGCSSDVAEWVAGNAPQAHMPVWALGKEQIKPGGYYRPSWSRSIRLHPIYMAMERASDRPPALVNWLLQRALDTGKPAVDAAVEAYQSVNPKWTRECKKEGKL